MRNPFIGTMVLTWALSGSAFGQASAPAPAESHKYRTIVTIAGAGAGFFAGVYIGIAAFEDAVNSDRKVWTTSIVGAAAGGVGGYFVGRALDRRNRKTAGLTIPLAGAAVEISPLVARARRGVQFAMRF